MFTTGLPGLTLALFSAASTAVAIPTGVQFFCFLATLLARSRRAVGADALHPRRRSSTFVIGGLTGVMVAMAPFNFQAHDTFFVVAHLHTVLIGGAVFPLLAGLYYYYPLVERETALRAARADRVLAGLHRLQRSRSCRCTPRAARHAAPGLHLSARAGLGHAEPGGRPPGRSCWPPASPSSPGTCVRSEATPAAGAAQSLGRRHARMAAGDARPAVGRCGPFPRSTRAIRSGSSRTSCATTTRAASTCPTPRKAGARCS